MLCCELLSFDSFSVSICPSKVSLLILLLNKLLHSLQQTLLVIIIWKGGDKVTEKTILKREKKSTIIIILKRSFYQSRMHKTKNSLHFVEILMQEEKLTFGLEK